MLCRSCSSCAVVGDSRDPTVAARFLSDQVVDTPVVFNDRCWCRSAENCEGPAVAALLTRWSTSLLAQFIDKLWTSCDHAATSGLVLEVPQIQFIARVVDSPVVQQRMVLDYAVVVMAAMTGFFFSGFSAFFALLRVVPRFSASFSSWGALDDEESISCSECVDINTLSEGSRQQQQQLLLPLPLPLPPPPPPP